jgi:hypothetical protein
VAVSEELEQSLRAEVERYVSARLSNQQAEILRVQSEINQALTRLAEQLTGEPSADAPISVAVAEHLRRAHTQGTEEANEQSARARTTSDMALMKAAVDEIEAQRSQADVLNALVNRAASFAPRVAFFVIKNERATGWRARGLEGTVGDDGVREISLPLSEQTILSEVAHSRTTWSGTPGTNEGDHELLQKLGGDPPQRLVAIPLVARERVVAVLYADSAALEPDAVNLEALETLMRITGMAVELLASRRPTAHTAEQSAAQAPAQPAPQPVEQAAPVAAESAPAAEEPAAEPRSTVAPEQPAVAQAGSAPAAYEEAAPPAHEEVAPPAHEETAPVYEAPAPVEAAAPASALFSPIETTTPPTAEQAFVAPVQPTAAPQEERGITPFMPPTSAPPSASPTAATGEPTATPLGTSRRYGQEVELPIEVSDDERRFHNDARRFARLLVSEIKLYNEQKVRDGREHGDLYERLREEIDRSRQMYDKRADPRVAARYDYFHQELVNTLAEGHPDKLGREYPGAQVAA